MIDLVLSLRKEKGQNGQFKKGHEEVLARGIASDARMLRSSMHATKRYAWHMESMCAAPGGYKRLILGLILLFKIQKRRHTRP
jgi:hypothetical protein